MKKLLLASAGALSLALTGADIFLVGDSTMCFYGAKYAPREGWGMHLQSRCRSGVTVHNCAVSGTSTKSFQDRGYWDKMLKELKSGDFVVISMGINDGSPKSTRPQNHTDLGGEFSGNLKRWIQQVRDRGAVPVLCTNTVVWSGKKRTAPLALNDRYNQEILAAAAEVKCDCVDLHGTVFAAFRTLTQPEILTLYLCIGGDYTHLSAKGAGYYAETFVRLCREQKLPLAALFR